MHELAVTEAIAKIVADYAREHGAVQVHRVYLRIGELSHLNAEWLQRYFDRFSTGTVAEGALLMIESIKTVFACLGCGRRFTHSIRSGKDVTCPQCGSMECSLVEGDDYVVERIEIT